MRYAVIATVIDSPNITGVERYAYEFIRYIPEDIKDNIVVFCHPSGAQLLKEVIPEAKLVVSPYSNRILMDQVWLPLEIRRHNIGFVYNISLSHPWIGFGRIPFALMVHDAVPWRFPETMSKGMRWYYFRQIRRALTSRFLKAIITNSSSSASDIARYANVSRQLIHPIHLGVDHVDYTLNNLESNSSEIVVPEEYILTVGTIEPRKNLKTLLSAFEEIHERWQELHLVIVGRNGWENGMRISDSIAERTRFTGYVNEFTLRLLYKRARVFVYPTLYEGFGFPLLEAMKAGVPCVASRTSSLPEIGGEACIYVDGATSVEAFVDAIEKVLEDEKLSDELTMLGYAQAAKFDWSHTFERTWNILRRLTEDT